MRSARIGKPSPENLPAVWPSMVEVTNVDRRDDGWQSFDWTHKMGGLRFHGKAETVRIEPRTYVEIENKSGIPSVFRWRYEPRGAKGMRLTVDVEYEIPTPVLGKIAEAILVKLNEHEMDTLLANVKATLEGARTDKGAGAHAHP